MRGANHIDIGLEVETLPSDPVATHKPEIPEHCCELLDRGMKP